MRYVVAAGTLKLFSSSPYARRLYRTLGNRCGGTRRAGASIEARPVNYLGRAAEAIALAEKHKLVWDGATLLEIGTGWVHWEATIFRLFYDVDATLVDVWDNRQLGAYKSYLRQLDRHIDTSFAVTQARAQRAHLLLARMLASETFEELYAATGFRYVVDPKGTLSGFPAEAFDLIISNAVLEHVDREILPEFVINNERLLLPGGHTFHVIDLNDHLAYFDPGAHPKQYLAYTERTWKLLFENGVQYFNRVQQPEWLALFGATNLDLVVSKQASGALDDLKVAPKFRRFSAEELAVETLLLVHGKPATGSPREAAVGTDSPRSLRSRAPEKAGAPEVSFLAD